MPSKAYLAQQPVAAQKLRGKFVMAQLQGAYWTLAPGSAGFVVLDREHVGGVQQLGRGMGKLNFIPWKVWKVNS